MNQLRVDNRFSNALRAELVAQVSKTSPARPRKHTRLLLGAGVVAGAGLLGGIGAAAAGLFVLPGGEKVTQMASPVTATYTGTAAVQLGVPPAGATGIELNLTCLTAGHFDYQDGAATACSAADAAGPGNMTRYTVNLTPGQQSVLIKTEPQTRWQLTAKYVKQERTEWGVNAKGETFGVESREKGDPDLIAVMTTQGTAGYVYAKELYGGPQPTSPEDAAKNFSTPRPPREIPAYLSDGETKVGVFEAGDGGAGKPSSPSILPAQ